MAKEKPVFQDEIDLLDYARIIVKRKITVLCFLTLSLVIINYFVYLSPQLYEAKSMLHVGSIVKPLMTAQDAGHHLEKNKLSISSSLEPRSYISVTHLLSMYNSGKIVFKDEENNEAISILVKDKNSLRAIDICNAIASMLDDEGRKIYAKERQIINSQIQEYEIERSMINRQLISLNDNLSEKRPESNKSSLRELKDFYEKKYEPLQSKISELKEKLIRAQYFWIVEDAAYTKTYNSLSFDQSLEIVGMGLMLGIIFAFFQEFWSNNFSNSH